MSPEAFCFLLFLFLNKKIFVVIDNFFFLEKKVLHLVIIRGENCLWLRTAARRRENHFKKW